MAKQETLTIFPEVEDITQDLTDEQFGVLMRAVIAYRFRGTEYSGNDSLVKFAFRYMSNQVDRGENAKLAKAKAAQERWKKQTDADECRRMQSGAEICETMQSDTPIQSIPIQSIPIQSIPKENKKEKKDKGLKQSTFEIFWQAYPRKEGKKKAQDAFAKVTVSLEALLSAIEIQKKTPQWEKDNGQYIPHPATWLNGKRWEDVPVDQSKSGKRQLDEDELAAIERLMDDEV